MAITIAEARWRYIYRNLKKSKRLHRRRRFCPSTSPQLWSNAHLLPYTTSSPITRSRSQQCYDAQAQSALFAKLPTEVRLMIWKAAIGGLYIHISPMRHPAGPSVFDGCHLCGRKIVHSDATLTYMACKNEDISGPDHDHARSPTCSRRLRLLSLLKTCRRMSVPL